MLQVKLFRNYMKKKILKVSLAGKTNAGKSTLVNNLVGEIISIINKKINTTEELIEGVLNFKNNQIIFYDTPGFFISKDKSTKSQKFKRNLWQGLNESDYIMFVIDIKNYKQNEVFLHLEKISELNKKIIVIFNKNDLVDKKKILPIIKKIDDYFKIDTFFSISAKKKLGLDEIKNYLIKNTYFSDWIYKNEQISNKDDIFISNECTRNAILSIVHKEIPYQVNISNIKFQFLKNGDLKIKQLIEYTNIRYKKIIIGKNGSKIKEIRVKSQNSISKIFKCKVHLYINVLEKNAKKT